MSFDQDVLLHCGRWCTLTSARHVAEHGEALAKGTDRGLPPGRLVYKTVGTKGELAVRVVIGELRGAEEDWVGRGESSLELPDGRLLIGRLDEECLDPRATPQPIEVEPGDYGVEVFTYLASAAGPHCYWKAGGDEPFAAWHRRTRPSEELPLWLQDELISGGGYEDPEFESHWMSILEDDKRLNPLRRTLDLRPPLDFVIRLTPGVPTPMPMPKDWDEIGMEDGARRLEVFPRTPVFGDPRG
ncbi:MAG: hypothetical protein AAF533_23800 [Acidobacteriota bacterium]